MRRSVCLCSSLSMLPVSVCLRMSLVCCRSSSWSLVVSVGLCRSRFSRAAARSLSSRVVQRNEPVNRLIINPSSSSSSSSSSSWSRTSRTSRTSSSMSSTTMSRRLVWVDLEMTGLDIEKDKIIEMACIITDADLNVLAEGPNLIINQPNELLEGMSEWCIEHHGKSGLTQAVQDSKITLEQAEYEFLSFVRQHTPPGQCPLAGNSVHADKKFLDKYMPQFMYHLHYRIVDVSTIKELCRRWFPEEYKLAPHKKAAHRALGDIQESIKELQYYRANIFKASTEDKKRRIVENGGSADS